MGEGISYGSSLEPAIDGAAGEVEEDDKEEEVICNAMTEMRSRALYLILTLTLSEVVCNECGWDEDVEGNDILLCAGASPATAESSQPSIIPSLTHPDPDPNPGAMVPVAAQHTTCVASAPPSRKCRRANGSAQLAHAASASST